MAKWGEIKCPRCAELEAERDALAEKLAAMEAKEKQRTDWYARQLRVD
jgi:phage FluMu protein Com